MNVLSLRRRHQPRRADDSSPGLPPSPVAPQASPLGLGPQKLQEVGYRRQRSSWCAT